ncbi:hybrid sensor histidine kinase/response regulator [Pseudoflavonifractor sp. 524-17]|uniref:hybrid sensor histidine kinase/response regulator n=1 Tax=Pseudoflavonifractor sp. 524-17 TaxID=2304577 RepID=UPI0013794386|nr:hybrid sensor histidine kinase/response regulator [Pseudoflavonifractor sp. 524-17]
MIAQKKQRGAAAIVAVLAVVILISIGYSGFASRQIYQESVSHLEEIYTQMNNTLRTTLTKNWRILRSWSRYVSSTAEANPEEFFAFLQTAKEDWHFASFYFLDEEGAYVTDLGETGRLELGDNLERLTRSGENIVVDGEGSGGEWVTIFAVPVQPGRYRDFDYGAIGMSFRTDDMTKALSIQAFSGKSDCFITYPDGRVLFSSQSREKQPEHFLDYLDRSGTFSQEDMEKIARDWANGEQRVTICHLDGTAYYLCYQPVGFSGWMLAGIAPVDLVNANMNSFVIATLVVMALLFGVIAVGIILSVIMSNRRRMVEKNREIYSREQLFDLLTENTDDIFILFSPKDFTAEYVSPNLERVVGLEPEEIRKDVRCLLFGEAEYMLPDGQQPLSPETLAAIPINSVWTGEQDILHAKTHELRWFKKLIHHCSLERRDQFILMLSDRTKERQMYETLGEALHTAKAANEAKSNFLANMSHDIRTPMNAIVGFSVLLGRDANDPEKVREYTRKIASSSQHLLGLINDILDMSKIESGKTSLNISEFSLPVLIDELYTMMLPQVRAKEQSFELYTKGSLPELLLGDKLRLNQVLINLLSNAVKYTQTGGHVSLTVEGLEQNTMRRAHLQFSVADDGYGMSEAFVQTIFDPFSREITEATREIQGTGLGMAITKNIIDLMGGTIFVQSELERGSTFTVEVELAVANPERDDAFWQHHSITRLLVVDDEEGICLGVQGAMDGTGVEVSYATDGATAVELAAGAHARGEAFHIILLDWKMPGIDGLETARRIRRRIGTEVPIFVLTSYDLEAAKEAAQGAEIDMFLPKPFFLSSFQRAVAQLLEGAEDAVDSPAQTETSLEGLKVLAAEDNEINAEILVELLEIEGVQCEVVSNGEEAVKRFTRTQPGEFDMIFMDVQMPVMDGYEATRAIRASSHPSAKSIPIIAMTANAFEEDIQAALAAGMSAHTAKPIDMDKLKATISRLWDFHQKKPKGGK